MMRVLFCLLLVAHVAYADPAGLPMSVTAGGAQHAVSSSGAAIHATIGQNAIRRMTGNSGAIHNGFWSGVNSSFPNPVRDERAALPTEFAFNPAYPNPFNPSTVLSFSLPRAAEIELSVFDITGRLVATPVSGKYQPGVYTALWSPEQLASGIYFARLAAPDFSHTQRLHLIK